MKRFAVLLAILAAARIAQADVGPSIEVRWLGPWPEPATSGRPLTGRLQLRTGIEGAVTDLSIGGNGWTLVSSDAPRAARLDPADRLVVRFTAIPADPGAPLQVRGRVDGVPFLQEFRLDAARLAQIGRPGAVRALHAPLLSGMPKTPRTEGGGRNIRFHGRFMYVRQDGRSTGADNIVVRVMDDDSPFADEEIGRFLTDPDGFFDATIFWDDCDITGCDEPDVYLVYEAANLVADVRHPDSDDLYTWRTGITPDFTGTDIDFGIQFPGTDDAAVHMYTDVIRAERHAASHGGMVPPLVHIYYPDPGQGAFYSNGLEQIHVGNPEAWVEGTHIHEYGHHLEKHFAVLLPSDYNNGYCDTPNPGHCVWCPENPTIAWQEGFANWFGSRVLRAWNGAYGYAPLSINDFRYTLETTTTCQVDNVAYPTSSTEGYVAALLRDIDDPQQDDEDGGDPDCIMDALALDDDEIFDVFQRDDPSTVGEFINDFRARYSQYDQDLWSTIENVAPDLNFIPPAPTIASQPATCRHVRLNEMVTLTVQGNGSLLNYHWRHNGVPITDSFGYEGFTTNTLQVQMLNSTLAGLYDCIVSTCDNSSSRTSAAERIQFDLPPSSAPLVTWGENLSGQVGDGTTSSSRSAYPWANLPDVIDADGGRNYGMALTRDGVVRTWGYSQFGELGRGAVGAHLNSPGTIGVSDAVDVAAGKYSGYALRRDGTILSWGYNGSGQLGTGNQSDRAAPGATQFQGCVRKIVAGEEHTVALLADGTVWECGYNGSFGTQGTGSFGGLALVPHQVTGLSNVTDVAAASYFTLALKDDGTVWAWGYNAFGELGNGTTNPSAVPVQVTGLTGARTIAAGPRNGFAIKTDGTAWGWGSSAWIGTGATTGLSLTPQAITALSGVSEIDCGETWVMALVDGKLKVWGDNFAGSTTQVGVFNTTTPPGSSNVPIDVPYVWNVNYFGTSFGTVFAYGSVAVTGVPGGTDVAPPTLALRALPNPTRGDATIEYDVPAQGFVSVRVYDAAGRLVRALVDEPRAPGRYSIAWNGRTAQGARGAAGVYFVRLSTAKGGLSRTLLRLD